MPNTTVNFSIANMGNGRVLFTPDQSFQDGTTVYIGNKQLTTVATLTNGVGSASIPATETPNVLMTFDIQEGTSPNWTTIDKVKVIVPNTTPQNYSALVNQYFSADRLYSSVNQIADAITTTYLSRLNLFNYQGVWASATTYSLNQYAGRGGNVYRYINASPSSNKDPLVATNIGTFWELFISKGDPGSGVTGAAAIGYNATIWTTSPTSLEAPSRADVKAAIDSVSTVIPSNVAKIDTAQSWTAKQTFGSNASGVTATTGTNNTDLATNAFVRQEITALQSVPLISTPIAHVQRTATQTFTKDAVTNVIWDTFPVQGAWDTGGGFTVPTTGNYLIFCKLRPTIISSDGSSTSRNITRVYWSRVTPTAVDVGNFFEQNEMGISNGAPFSFTRDGWWFGGMTAGEVYSTRILVSGSSPSTTANAQSVGGSAGNNRLIIWRVA